MLKKKNRLTTKKFTEVFKKGEKKFSQNFLFIVKNKSAIENNGKKDDNIKNSEKKISVAISKKVEKRAVDRVKSRRIIYRILQENFEKIPENLAAIFLIIKPLLEIDKKILQQEVLKHLKSIK